GARADAQAAFGRSPGRRLLAGRGALRDAHRRPAARPVRPAVGEVAGGAAPRPDRAPRPGPGDRPALPARPRAETRPGGAPLPRRAGAPDGVAGGQLVAEAPHGPVPHPELAARHVVGLFLGARADAPRG